MASFTADGANDQDRVCADVAQHHPEAAVIGPPRATAMSSATAATAPTQRDRRLQHVIPRGSPDVAEHGRMAWQRASGYTTRSRAEAAIGRFKQRIGDGLRLRTDERRATEVKVAVHAFSCMLELRHPIYVRVVA